MKRDKKLWIRCSEKEHEKIKELAEKNNTAVSDYVLSRALGLPLVQAEEKEYEFTVKDKKGIGRKYSHKYIPKKKIVCKGLPEEEDFEELDLFETQD